MIDEVDVDGFDVEHQRQKQKRQDKRNSRGVQRGGAGKRIHRVGGEERWRFDPTKGFDDGEE